MELKQTKAGQHVDQQGKKRQITAKQSETKQNIVMIKLASQVARFGSTQTPKLAVLLFRNTTETSLFVLNNVKTSLDSFDMNQVS